MFLSVDRLSVNYCLLLPNASDACLASWMSRQCRWQHFNALRGKTDSHQNLTTSASSGTRIKLATVYPDCYSLPAGLLFEGSPTFEDLSCLCKCVSDYGGFASIDADPIAFNFRFADGSRGMHRCADVSERAIWEIRHLTGCM